MKRCGTFDRDTNNLAVKTRLFQLVKQKKRNGCRKRRRVGGGFREMKNRRQEKFYETN